MIGRGGRRILRGDLAGGEWGSGLVKHDPIDLRNEIAGLRRRSGGFPPAGGAAAFHLSGVLAAAKIGLRSPEMRFSAAEWGFWSPEKRRGIGGSGSGGGMSWRGGEWSGAH